MDSITSTFVIKNKIFLQGDFVGKYEANQFATLSNCNLSKINILEGKLDNVQRCDFNSLFNIQTESLQHQDGFNVELKLDDELLTDKYVFIEEFYNSTIYDITLSDHQIDDNDTFGVIKGKMICALEDSCEFDLFSDNTYTITKEIDFEDSTYSLVKIVKGFSRWSIRPFKRSFNFIKSKFFSFIKK
jgi:hypothetical protein